VVTPLSQDQHDSYLVDDLNSRLGNHTKHSIDKNWHTSFGFTIRAIEETKNK